MQDARCENKFKKIKTHQVRSSSFATKAGLHRVRHRDCPVSLPRRLDSLGGNPYHAADQLPDRTRDQVTQHGLLPQRIRGEQRGFQRFVDAEVERERRAFFEQVGREAVVQREETRRGEGHAEWLEDFVLFGWGFWRVLESVRRISLTPFDSRVLIRDCRDVEFFHRRGGHVDDGRRLQRGTRTTAVIVRPGRRSRRRSKSVSSRKRIVVPVEGR